MAARNYSANAVETTLSGAITDSAGSLTVTATTGFPSPPFIIAVDAEAANQEVMLVTGVGGSTLTVTRGYDSTTASAHEVGAVVQHSHTALDFREANTHVNATSGAHGVTGSLVGTSDTQTLTNKTIDLTDNTLTGTAAEFNAGVSDDNFATLTGTETLSNKTLASPTITGGAWSDYTPTFTNLTVGNGTLVAKYKQVGKHVQVRVSLAGGSTSSASGHVQITLPVAAHASGIQSMPFRLYTTGTTQYMGFATTSSTAGSGKVYCYLPDGSPFDTFGNGYNFDIVGSYEAA